MTFPFLDQLFLCFCFNPLKDFNNHLFFLGVSTAEWNIYDETAITSIQANMTAFEKYFKIGFNRGTLLPYITVHINWKTLVRHNITDHY